MLPQPPLPRMSPSAPPRTLAKPPKAPLRGQGPSGTPPSPQDDAIKAIAMQQAQAAQPAPVRAQPAPVPVRYSPAPAAAPAPTYAPQQQPQQPQPRAPSPQQQMAPDPRAQAIDAMKAKTGGDYPNPEWQPQPAYLKTTEPYAPAPVGNVVPATSAPAPVRYSPPAPSAAPVAAVPAPSTVPQGLPPALLPDDLLPYEPERAGADVFIPKSPVAMNPRFDPNAPHGGTPDPTIGPDGQTIPPRPILRPSPVRAEETTGADPSGQFDWESLADALGIGGLQDQVKETTAKEALGAMTSDLSEFGFNPEELQAQEDQIIRQAAEAKAKAMQQMAGRGLGGSGLEIAGLGNIDVGAISAITDLKTENKALQIEQRLNEIKMYLSAYGSQLDDETRNTLAAEAMDLEKEQMAEAKADQDEGDNWNVMNNLMAQTGADAFTPGAWSWVMDQLEAGISPQEAFKVFTVGVDSDTGQKTLRLDPKKAPPPPNWNGTEEEWRSLADWQMDEAYAAYQAGNSYDDAEYGFTPGTAPEGA